jgi:hypothetical protein
LPVHHGHGPGTPPSHACWLSPDEFATGIARESLKLVAIDTA